MHNTQVLCHSTIATAAAVTAAAATTTNNQYPIRFVLAAGLVASRQTFTSKTMQAQRAGAAL
jgi:hypothetical protein